MALPKPINETQRRFHELCRLGGGQKGGPARTKVQEMLHDAGTRLNVIAQSEISAMLEEFAGSNPWHVCFAVGLCWGHLAKFDSEFVGAAIRLLESWNNDDLKIAKSFHYERGPDAIEQSLKGGNAMFAGVVLPKTLPDTLEKYRRAQERWLGRILGPNRPRYIGSWNATAMFMVGLFSDRALADQLTSPMVMLPPGGPYSVLRSFVCTSHG